MYNWKGIGVVLIIGLLGGILGGGLVWLLPVRQRVVTELRHETTVHHVVQVNKTVTTQLQPPDPGCANGKSGVLMTIETEHETTGDNGAWDYSTMATFDMGNHQLLTCKFSTTNDMTQVWHPGQTLMINGGSAIQ